MPATMIPHDFTRLSPKRGRQRADEFYEELDRRRSVRYFSSEPVPRHLIEQAVRTASTAPSGAHREDVMVTVDSE